MATSDRQADRAALGWDTGDPADSPVGGRGLLRIRLLPRCSYMSWQSQNTIPLSVSQPVSLWKLTPTPLERQPKGKKQKRQPHQLFSKLRSEVAGGLR